MISRLSFSVGLMFGFISALATASAQPDGIGSAPAPRLYGHIQNGLYFSPTNTFAISVPVMPELGGTTTDAPNGVVTFQDDVNTHVSIGSFAMDATLRWTDETRGRKDFLVGFFEQIVRDDFLRHFPGTKIESAHFRPNLMGGAVFAYVLLPGGTMFSDKVIISDSEPPIVAKRGNLLFVREEHVFLISCELAEKVLERSTWNKTPEEEDKILEKHLMEILLNMTFPKTVTAADTSSVTTHSTPTGAVAAKPTAPSPLPTTTPSGK